MARQARLVYSDDDGEQELLLDQETETSIGRHPSCSITVSQPSVSRRHARLWWEAGGYYVQDLDSSNGTYINNQRVTKASLADGDELRCGDFKLRYVEAGAGTMVEAIEEAAGPRVVGTIRPRSDPPSVDPSKSVAPVAVGRISKRPGVPPKRSRPTPRPVGRIDGPGDGLGDGLGIEARATVQPSTPFPDDGEIARLKKEVEHWRSQAEGLSLVAESRPAEPAGPDPASVAKIEELEVDLAESRGEGDALRQEIDGLRRQLGDLEADLDEKARRIQELESAKLHADEQVTTLTERAVRLKEQLQEHSDQIDRARREQVELEVQLAEAREQARGLQGAHEQSGHREVELVEQVNDLKREVRQRDKGLKEIERQLDLAEYNLKAAREENENLRLALGEDDDARKDLNTTLDHLRQVLAEKEAMIERLQAQGGGQEAAPDAGLAQRCAELEAELDELRRSTEDRGGTPGRRVMEQLNELRRANRDLRNQLAETSGGGDPERVGELELALVEAQQHARRLEEALDQAQAAPAVVDDGRYDTLKDAAVQAYEALNDLASDLRMNVELSMDYVTELKGAVEAVVAGNAGAVQDADVPFTIESAEETMANAKLASDDFKSAMRALRETLVQHGYGG